MEPVDIQDLKPEDMKVGHAKSEEEKAKELEEWAILKPLAQKLRMDLENNQITLKPQLQRSNSEQDQKL